MGLTDLLIFISSVDRHDPVLCEEKRNEREVVSFRLNDDDDERVVVVVVVLVLLLLVDVPSLLFDEGKICWRSGCVEEEIDDEGGDGRE
jgi:hypothetical protein